MSLKWKQEHMVEGNLCNQEQLSVFFVIFQTHGGFDEVRHDIGLRVIIRKGISVLGASFHDIIVELLFLLDVIYVDAALFPSNVGSTDQKVQQRLRLGRDVRFFFQNNCFRNK